MSRLRNFRVSDEEDAAIKLRAESYGMTVSEYLRAAAIGMAPGPLRELATSIPAADLVANVVAGTSDADREMIRRAAVGTDAERADLMAALVSHALRRNAPPSRQFMQAIPEAGRMATDRIARVIEAVQAGDSPRDALRDVPFVIEEKPHPDWRAEAELGRRRQDEDRREGLVPGEPSDLSRMTPKARAIFEAGAAILAAEGR